MTTLAALRLGNPTERLAKILKENKEKLNLSKDGFVSVDLSNEETIKAINDQMDKLATIKVQKYNRRR
ncbi:hypothetical protein [Serratia liquefaciens]|uniref:Multidrug ABC transporter ATPase n=2 Tax=Serratia TaxID=613 RepID=A0AA93BXI3_9GAMM|nr:hypothetical protein [Serratia liquefaciens]AKE10942.1 multidrug ABC transporter ATPase [Serratia liquefaciens]RJF58068.1 multidrug ABC transporter ATPase [Serratia inhibens]